MTRPDRERVEPAPIERTARIGRTSITASKTLVATTLLAIGVPVIASRYTRARTADLADRLTAASGVPVTIDRIDADLGGSVRVTDVALGDLLAVDAIEGSVGMSSLLDGQLRVDEIRVEGPRVAIAVDADGDSDLARTARRLARRRTRGATGDPEGPRRLRRIVVVGGTLTARIAGVGELSAEGVELVPEAAGVRILTGPVRLKGGDDRIAVDLAFDRSAAELALPAMHFGRALAVGGGGVVQLARGPLVLRDLAVGRRVAGGALELRANVDDDGAVRPLAVDLALASPRDDAHAGALDPSARHLTLAIEGEHLPLRAFAGLAPHGLDLSDAHGSGSVVVRRAPHQLQLSIDGTLEQVAVDHPTVTSEPLALAGRVRADVAISPDAVALSDASVQLGALELAGSGWLRRGAPASGQLELALAPAACQELLATLPDSLRGPLDGMVVRGTLAGRLHLGIDLAAPLGEGTTLDGDLLDDCRVTAEPPAGDVARLAATGEMRLADGSRRRVGTDEPGYATSRAIPSHVAAAFVSAEDGRFFHHDGFDLEQIARSLEIDLREHRLVRGGSTISQQLVKNAFLSQRRSFDRKLQEAILTWRLEERLSKRQILERYLNIIELGPHVFGITAAARHWFGTTPRDLTIKQAAFLAALTSQPSTMSRRVRRARGLDRESAERVAVVLRAMRRDGAIGPAAAEAARTAPIDFAPSALLPER